ncbi:hypothetical protein BJ165DRAFT_1499142 [Panaeolus papilionaceus]|nr:hypothetical protein BJ165DRAFT_1499142 [Panaeolus papilionaceus]
MTQSNIDIAKLCETVELSAQSGVPYISGTFPLGPNESVVFYRSPDGTNGHVDFANATKEDLKALATACQPATFGFGDADVLDETYRKAGKMDSANFAAQVSPSNHGILDFVHQDLFNADDCPDIRLQMYKLNIYGPGSFFKAHVDTPRGADMFGSLVIVLPTPHEGGSLIFRHAGQEWVIDTAKAVSSASQSSQTTSPHAAFAAFYSDVEHEVTPVISGYRVTLTYLLYFARTPISKHIQPRSSAQQDVQDSLSALLDVADFLPAGGHLGFKLVHKYSLTSKGEPDLDILQSSLKGPDARLLSACQMLGLISFLRLFYRVDEDEKQKYISKKPINAGGDYGDDFSAKELMEETNAKRVKDYDLVTGINFKDSSKYTVANTNINEGGDSEEEEGDNASDDEDSDDSYTRSAPKNLPKFPIFWINPDNEALTRAGSQYTYYAGNDASIGHLYGEIALVIRIGPHGNRRTAKATE